jgi:superfamily II DNA or RNA helicase
MQLRPYQQSAIDQYMAQRPARCLIVAPTGSGKTVLVASIVEQLPGTVLFLTHRWEILQQAASYFGACNVIKSGADQQIGARITVAQVQTLARRTLPPANIVISDEAHHIRGEQWRTILDAYPAARHIGLTATPWRLDGKGLGSIYGTVIEVATTDDLIRDGYLVRPEYWGAKIEPDLRRVSKSAGDYNQIELGLACNQRHIIGGIANNIALRCTDRHTVIYAVDCDHARAICAEIPGAHYLDGRTDDDDRARMLNWFSGDGARVLCNVGVLTEGWDSPRADCILLARPTCSASLYMQMVGRALRPAPGKRNALILDHGGNVQRHGFAEDRRSWSLADGLVTRKTKACESLHTCRLCLAIFAGQVCPLCQHERAPTRAEINEKRKELEKLERSQMDQTELELEYKKFLWWAKKTGRPPGAAYGRFKNLFQRAPDPAWQKGMIKWENRKPVWA